jgi:hypothetical protein
MASQSPTKPKIHLDRFTVLAPVPPFVDILLQKSSIGREEFPKITELAASYPDDPRMVEMVRKAGDASAKVPYLLDRGETPAAILDVLREIAAPHVERLKTLPEGVQAAVHTLLSINMVPSGYEKYGIPALLEIDRIQKEMTETLRAEMAHRSMAQEFHQVNHTALRLLDQEWAHIRKSDAPWPYAHTLPEQTGLQYIPIFYNDYLVGVREMCVIVDSPLAHELRSLTPRILQHPLPEDLTAPLTGSADWLLRVVGKIGRHFTRALLDILLKHLASRRILPGLKEYDLINYESQRAFRLFVESTP